MGTVSVLKTDIKIQELRPKQPQKRGVRAVLSTNITSFLPDASSRHPRYLPCNSSRRGGRDPACGAFLGRSSPGCAYPWLSTEPQKGRQVLATAPTPSSRHPLPTRSRYNPRHR